MAMSKVSKSSADILPSIGTIPSPIPFVSKLKKMDKVNGPDARKTQYTKLEFFMGPDNAATEFKYSRNLVIFNDGTQRSRSGAHLLMSFVRLRIYCP
jgi:hypothetical protein